MSFKSLKLAVLSTVSLVKESKEMPSFSVSPLHIPKDLISTNNEFVNSSCGLCLLDKTTPMAMCAFIPNTKEGYRIFVNDAFNDQPVWFKSAVLKHEEGHYVLNHLNDSRTLTTVEMELEADQYALKAGEDVLGSLVLSCQIRKTFITSNVMIERLKAMINNPKLVNHYLRKEAITIVNAHRLAFKLKLIK